MDKIPAEHFVKTIAANANNDELDDKAFRQLVRNTLPIVKGGDYKEGKGFSRLNDQRGDGNSQERR